MQINTGPFKGLTIPEHEIGTYSSYPDAEEKRYWTTAARTRHFLDKFPMTEGYAITVSHSHGPFDLPDYRKAAASGEIQIQPTHLFIATFSRNGVVLNQASALVIIDAPSAWEKGEDIARGRLYAACGLPTWIDESDSTRNYGNRPRQHQTPLVQPQHAAAVTPDAIGVVGESTTDEPAAIEAAPSADVIPHPAAASTTATVRSADSQPSGIGPAVNDNLREQIIQQAAVLKVEIPSITTNAQAKEFYKKLLVQASAGGS